jgi:hypothetical protein
VAKMKKISIVPGLPLNSKDASLEELRKQWYHQNKKVRSVERWSLLFDLQPSIEKVDFMR